MPIIQGYECIKLKGHPLASKNGVVFVHRKVWFEHNGEIPKGFVIHHKNGNKLDNRIENLEMCSRSEHMKEHYKEGLGVLNGEAAMCELTCVICGTKFIRKQSMNAYNDKHKNSKHALRTCSRSCWAVVANAYKHGTVEKIIDRAMKGKP